MGILNTLITRALRPSRKEHFHQVINHLMKAFLDIVYNYKEISRDIKRANRSPPSNNCHPSIGKEFLEYICCTTDKIARILKIKDIVTSFKPLETIRYKMRYVKDKFDHFQCKGIYKIN